MRGNDDRRLIESFSKDMSLADALEFLFENARDAIYILDTRGKFVACNRKAEELTGFKRKDWIGKSFRKIIPVENLPKAIRGFLNVIRGKAIRLELELRTATKKKVLVEVTSTPLINNRKIVGALGIARDINEGKQVEGELQRSEERLKTILDSIHTGIVIIDKETHVIVDANPIAIEMIGAPKEQVIGSVCHDYICPAEKGRCPITDLGQNVDNSERVLLKTNRKSVPILKTVVSTIINGRERLIESFIDITERKKMEEAIRKSGEKYRTLMDDAPIAIFNVNLNGKITYVNKRFEQDTGYSREEIVDKNAFKLNIVSDETLKFLAKRMKALLMGKPARCVEVQLRCKDGRWIWADMESRIIKKLRVPVGFQITARNITERKRAEEALRESEEKYRGIIELAPMAMVTMDLKGVITSCNAFMTLSGYSKDEIIGKRFSDIGWLQIRDLPKYLKMFSSIIRGKVPEPFEISYRHKDGEPHVGEVYISLMKKNGKVIGIQSVMMDITERKKKEREIRESKEKFERLFMDNPEAAVYVNPDFHILDVNPCFSELFGYSLDEVKGKHINSAIVPKDKMEEAEMLDKKAEKRYFFHGTVRKRKDGSLVPVSISVAPITVEGRLTGYVGLYKDVTERKQMERKLQEYSEHLEELVEKRTRQLKEAQERLLKSERLAAIGEIAAMVGHDLRNPLTSIAGATYYLKTKLEQKMDKTAKDMVELIEKDIKYSDLIISDLLRYSREIHLELTETTPKSITKHALTSIKVPKNIRISNLTDNKPKIKIDAQKMNRVLVNITKNAIDAMPKGGKLTITSKKTNGKLEITFTDTGRGMQKDILEKIWTPLFTTKAKGMGLGLPICKRIVEAHGGDISVESIVGKGTTFTVTIPIKPKLEGGEKIWVNVPESLLSTTTKA